MGFLTSDDKRTCNKKVLEFIAKEMKDEWNEFLEILNIKSGSNNAILTEGENGKENIESFFKSKGWLVKWEVLEETLFDMGKRDVVEQIKKKFLYTRGNNFKLLLSFSIRQLWQ